ncbi:MAG TPA: hypothetical protein VE986_00865, partial [Hyphomicrobiales bacterium]|nr:hypothetical protein [Hyphomicrobiales bacterium]
MATESILHGQAEAHRTAPAAKGKPIFKTENPATGQPGRVYEGHTLEEATAIARDAHAAFA